MDNLRNLILNVQDWYGQQMSRYGFGYTTFQLELESDGITPKVNVVTTGMTDEYIRADLWGRTISAATEAGLTPWSNGEVWLLVPETHLELPDGSHIGGSSLGTSSGQGYGTDAGVALLDSAGLYLNHEHMLQNTQLYHGAIIPQYGPYPLVQDVTSYWFDGYTFSEIASTSQGAAAHELGHAFGLGHNFRNDDNADGMIMGNGFRGWRGSRLPTQFSANDVQLGYAEALALSTSRYFNATQPISDAARPSIEIATSGSVPVLVNGQLDIFFNASDSQGLAGALLRRNGDTIGELVLSGTSVSSHFSTAFYQPDADDTYMISVYDAQGNRSDASVSITVASSPNRAPQPFIDLSQSVLSIGQTVILDATWSLDPDGPFPEMTVQWDLDGNGAFETAPSTNKLFQTSY